MTPRRSGTVIRSIRDISVGAALSMSLLAGFSLQSCSNSSENDYETVEEVVYTKGVRTHIKETSPGIFKIMDEESVSADSSEAIISYADGHTDRLQPQAAKALIDNKIQKDQTMVGVDNSLANALLLGGMGYLLANQMNYGYLNTYRNDFYKAETTNNNTSKQDTSQRRNHYRRSGIGFFPMIFANQQAYNRSTGVTETVKTSRTTRISTRPIGGRSGFFGGSSRSGRS
jgi:hypothetical protein